MGSALLNTTTEQEFAGEAGVDGPTLRRVAKDGAPELRGAPELLGVGELQGADALRMEVAERLAAHRKRRGGPEAMARVAEPVRSGSTRSARIAATVAERYAHTPTYRAFLAAEAERAVEQARAAAAVAAMNAQAVADAQQKMLDAFDEAAMAQAAMQAEMPAGEAERAGLEEVRGAQAQVGEAPAAAMAPELHAAEQNLWPDLDREEARQPPVDSTRPMALPNSRGTDAAGEAAKASAAPAVRAAGLTVRLYEAGPGGAGPGAAHGYCGVTQRVPAAAHTNRRDYSNAAEAMALDEEIAFRRAPSFEEPAGPPLPLPANLIEFPRQLVASRKARPRLAEGPLREEAEAAPGGGQLRIFEVESAQISTQPAGVGSDTPQWSSIWLDTPAEAPAIEEAADVEQWQDHAGEAIDRPVAHRLPAVQAASIARRVAAAGIDLSIAMLGAFAFAATAAAVFSRVEGLQAIEWNSGGPLLANARLLGAWIAAQTGLQPGQFAAVGAVAGVALIVLYQGLFFWFSDATPGMRCARIALCTFGDENPTRRSVRRRLGAMLLSACALGFGFVWALLDEDRLTWHDRITRMYLRSY